MSCVPAIRSARIDFHSYEQRVITQFDEVISGLVILRGTFEKGQQINQSKEIILGFGRWDFDIKVGGKWQVGLDVAL